MRTLILLFLTLSISACATEPKKPACFDQSEACQDAWYQYGDETGDYGPIDAAE